jgi:hypothetical protein
MSTLEFNIIKELKSMNDELSIENEIKFAFCGKCKYNDKIKNFHENNFYPLCSCIIDYNISLIQCNNDQISDEGKQFPKCKNNSGELKGLNFCPPGYYIEKIPIYDIMIFFDSKDIPESEVNNIKLNYIKDIIKKFDLELIRLKSLYNGFFSSIFNIVNFNKIHDIELYITILWNSVLKLLIERISNCINNV